MLRYETSGTQTLRAMTAIYKARCFRPNSELAPGHYKRQLCVDGKWSVVGPLVFTDSRISQWHSTTANAGNRRCVFHGPRWPIYADAGVTILAQVYCGCSGCYEQRPDASTRPWSACGAFKTTANWRTTSVRRWKTSETAARRESSSTATGTRFNLSFSRYFTALDWSVGLENWSQGPFSLQDTLGYQNKSYANCMCSWKFIKWIKQLNDIKPFFVPYMYICLNKAIRLLLFSFPLHS